MRSEAVFAWSSIAHLLQPKENVRPEARVSNPTAGQLTAPSMTCEAACLYMLPKGLKVSFDRRVSTSSLVVVWLLLFPLLFFAVRGRFSYERTGDNNAITYSAGTLTRAGADSAYFRLEQASVYVIVLAAIVPFLLANTRARSWRFSYWLAPLPTWACVSCIWSQDPVHTITAGIAICLLTYFGVYLARRFNPEQQMELVMFLGWFVIAGSFGVALLYPAAGIAQFDGNGAWQGIFIHKNHCALAVSFLVAVAFFRKPKTTSERINQAIYIVSGSSLIILTQSRTGWLLLGSILAFALFAKVLPRIARRERVVLFVLALVVVATAAILAVCYFSQIALLLGKSSDLTGRTQIWRAIFPVLWKRPFVGFGYQAFWIGMKGESANLEMATGYIGLANGENAVLQIWLELGIVGVALLLMMLWKGSRTAIKCILHCPSPTVMWYSVLIFLTLLALVDGDKIMFPHTLQWLLFVVAFVGLSDQSRQDPNSGQGLVR